MKRLVCLALLAVTPSIIDGYCAEQEPPAQRATANAAPNFNLLDYRGRSYELRRTEGRMVVLYIAGNGCPIVRQSISKLRAFRAKFAAQGVTVWMLNANPQDSRSEIAAEANEFHIGSIPILMDEQQLVARALGLTRTGEAIAISLPDLQIVYRGAIDDQMVEGAKKAEPTRKHLEIAVTEFLAGKPVQEPKTSARGCVISLQHSLQANAKPISYVREIAPLLREKCASCHRPGDVAPFSMSSHRKVKGWSDMIREVLVARRMPPWHADPHVGKFANDRSLTSAEANLLLNWMDQGCPRDEGPDPLEQVKAKPSVWPLGQPDYVIALPKTEKIPATGIVQYRYRTADFTMTNDAWVRAAVARPDNLKVVHHIIVRVIYPEGSKHSDEEVFFTSWAPGNSLPECPPGTAKFLPKGSKFNFELHYNPYGTAAEDRSELGLYVTTQAPRYVFETRTAENREFTISPGESAMPAHAIYGFKKDTILYDLIPHMHLRGASFQYEALYPTGRRETLLSVPNYDFNWQTEYRLAEPKRIPAGTWLLCTGTFDNSARNPANPDPTKRVRWGLQSQDEMFMGFMNVAEIPASGDSGPKPQ